MPGGGKNNYHHSFLKLGFEGKVVPFDAAGALWQFASHHAWDYLRGNYTPALNEWGNLLVYLRSICKWKLVVYLDGSENSCDYKVHRSSAKQNPSSFQFAYERTRKLFKLLREQP